MHGDMMNKVIGVTDLQRKMRSVIDEVERGICFVITKGSRPKAALIPYEEFLRFQEMLEKETLARFDRLIARMRELNAGYPDEEVEADVEEALREISGDKGGD
jgi:prevent-host-death family protein